MPRRHANTKAVDMPQMTKLYLQGYSQTEIAARLGVSQQQVSKDLMQVRKELQEEAKRETAEANAELAMQFRLVAKEAWEAHGAAKDGGEATEKYLNVILKAVESEGKLRGAFTTKHEVDGSIRTIVLRTNLEDADE